MQNEIPSAKVLSRARFADNGNIFTTAGISAGIDGALHLVTKIYGKEIAQKMEYDKWQPENGVIAQQSK